MKKTLLALVLVLAMALPMFASAAAEVSAPGEFPIVSEPIVLTAAVAQTAIQIDFNDIQILKDFEEKSGIDIQYTCIPADLRVERLNLMLASGDLPDILYKMNVSSTDQAKYAEEGLFVDLTQYKELMPNLWKWYEEYPTALAAVTQKDGKVYAANYILAGYAIRMGSRLYFNTDLMAKLGYETIPTTTADLLEFFRAAKAYDYNGNGAADEIPLSASDVPSIQEVFKGSFGLNNRGSSHTYVYVDENDELQFSYTSEKYQKLLGFLNTMYSEGLLDQDLFTNDLAALIAKSSEGRVLTYSMVNNTPVTNTAYEAFTLGMTEPFEGPDGDKIWGSYSMPASTGGQFVITYKNQNPEASARWSDYWYTDEGIISYFMGVEGVTYEADANSPGGYKLTDFVVNNPDGINFEQVMATYVPWAGGANPSVATNEYFKGGETWPVSVASAEGLINYVPENVWAPFMYSADESVEMSSLKADIDTYLEEWRANFMTGQKSLTDDWDEYVAGYEALGLSRYMEIYRAARADYAAQ